MFFFSSSSTSVTTESRKVYCYELKCVPTNTHVEVLAPSSLDCIWREGPKEVIKLMGGILKSIDITLPTKVHLVKAMVFPVVMYGCESWTVKKAERRRIDAFLFVCLFLILFYF